MVQINESTLRKMIKDELKSLLEGVDHEAISNVVTSSSKLLDALNKFKETATIEMLNSMTPHIDDLISKTEAMLTNPGSFVAKPKKEVKKVSLRAQPPTE